MSAWIEPNLFDLAAAPAPVRQAVCDGPAIAPTFDARPYQRAAVDAIKSAFIAFRSALAVLCTASGKTHIFAHVIDETPGGRVMVLAHRDELIRQAQRKIQSVTHERATVEKAEFTASQSRIVVSSIQTQISKDRRTGKYRYEKFDPKQFGLLIVDEAHRAASPSYRQTIDYYMQGNLNMKLLGVTATPDRLDRLALGSIFQTVAYKFPIFDAIEAGWVVSVRQHPVTVTGLDFSKVKTMGGDLHGAQLDAVLRAEKIIHGMAVPAIEIGCGLPQHFLRDLIEQYPREQWDEGRRILLNRLASCHRRQCLIFCASVEHAKAFASVLNRWIPGCAAGISAKTHRDTRRELFHEFAQRHFQFLCNVGIITEGTDLPGVEVVFLGRPTKSRALQEQMIGRGLRPHESLAHELGTIATPEARRAVIAASPKQFCEVVDFVGNCGKHKLVTPVDVLGGNYSADAKKLAAKKSKAKPGIPADVIELLKLAQDELDHVAQSRKQADELEQQRRQHIKASVTYKVGSVDPFDLYDVKPPKEAKWDKLPRPTDGQCRRLTEIGAKYGFRVEDPQKITRGEAGRIINQFRDRITPAQMRVLMRNGTYRADEIRNLTKRDASRLIDRTAANGWHRPEVERRGAA